MAEAGRALVGSASAALCRKYVDRAIGTKRQIGSTPYVVRCWSMNATITSAGGRAPPARKTRPPSGGSRWRASVFSRRSAFSFMAFVGGQAGPRTGVAFGLAHPPP
jgi:hypothetical protein